MSTLSQQMHQRMTLRLSELRQQVLGQMVVTGERIKKRPAVDDSYSQIKSHAVMQKNDDGATVLGFVVGVPGLNETMNATVDVATEIYGDRKAVHERPQDQKPLSAKQERQIRDLNRMDLKLFKDLDEKLELLSTAMSCGHHWGYIDKTGELQMLETPVQPVFEPTIKPINENGFFASLTPQRSRFGALHHHG